MDIENLGSRRAVLKAGVALAAFAAAGGMLAACEKTETAAPATPAAPAAPVAATKYGKVKGKLEDGISVFKGVRYGADTGANRFGPPAEPAAWEGELETIAYGNTAPQNVAGDGGGLFKSWRPDPVPLQSEDCLFLNVWTPAVDTGKRPVLVWFHGGGFTTGSGSSNAYDGVRLAKRGDVVVVTVNHRLNVFGHLNLSKYGSDFADSGAAGSLDMVHALKWVKENIHSFGGDPTNVLIFGQSGGGAKICTLMAMDSAQGLFHRAVVQSGPRIRHAEMEATAKAADGYVKKLGLTKETIAQIKTMPMADLLKAFADTPDAATGPVLDGRSIKRHPFDPDAPAVSNTVPLLIGVTRTEGTSLEGGRDPKLFDITWETLPAELKKAFPDKDARKIIDLYKKDYPDIEAPELFFTATSDNRFFRGSVTIADRRSSAAGAAPVYFYMLDWETPVMGGKRYVPHALDIGMIFDNVAKSESMSGTGADAQAIADQMAESWLAFAKTGNPANPKLPEWPAYTAADRSMMVYRAQPGVEKDIRAAERALTAPKV